MAVPSDPECCSQVLPCYHKCFRAPAPVARAGLVLGCRGSGYLPGEGPPQEPATLQLGRRTTWQGWAHGRCQSFYNGGLQPPNTSFRAAVTKPRLTPWLWAEDAGVGRRGRLFGRLCQAGVERGGDWPLYEASFPPGELCSHHPPPCFSLLTDRPVSTEPTKPL